MTRHVHILRFAPGDKIAIEWLDQHEEWTEDQERAGNFAALTEAELEALALRVHGMIPSDCRQYHRTAPHQREFAAVSSRQSRAADRPLNTDH